MAPHLTVHFFHHIEVVAPLQKISISKAQAQSIIKHWSDTNKVEHPLRCVADLKL
jgi:hypothetical protein